VLAAAAAEEEDRPRTRSGPVTPAQRALAARRAAAETIPNAMVCRGCALELVELMVREAVEDAERDLRAALKEQIECPN
jgi:hypothetical protein